MHKFRYYYFKNVIYFHVLKIGIPKDILASSFGKCSRDDGPLCKYNEVDIMKSLLISFTINIG